MRLIQTTLLLVASMMLTGCFEFRTYVESYKPVIPVPEQEALHPLPQDGELFNEDGTIKDPDKLINAYHTVGYNLVVVINELETLREVVQAYNEWAHQQNVETGYTLPDPVTQPNN